MTTWVRCLAAALLLAVLGLPGRAEATSALFLTEIEHAEESTAVVVATVASQRVERHPHWGRPITLSTLTIEEVLWGKAPAKVEIEQFGGELDGLTTRVAGDARLALGERCVLFLREVDGGWYLTAMEQSKYDLKVGEEIERALSSAYFRHDAQGILTPYEDHEPPSPTLGELRTRLRERAATPLERAPARAAGQ